MAAFFCKKYRKAIALNIISMKDKINFIIIDDDPVYNSICQMTIQMAIPESDIETFLTPEEGFAYIATQYLTTNNPTILLLDINMPTWSGWDFLDHFERLDKKIKKQIHIHMHSSSVGDDERNRAIDNKNVTDFIEKPITVQVLQKMFGEAKH